MANDFITTLENKIKEQTNSRMVGFLLGAGSSYLNGEGYPLAGQLWDKISDDIPEAERIEIQKKLDGGATGLEHALDLLDVGGANEDQHRHNVVEALANHFCSVEAPLDCHRLFVSLISRRQEEQQGRTNLTN